MENAVSNEKKINRIKNFDRATLLYAYAFLFVPVLLFMLFWTKLYIGIPFALFACVGFYFIARAKREYKDIFSEGYSKKIFIIGIAALIWTLLSGQGGLFFQNIDYNMRNAIFHDLVKFDWPVIFNVFGDIINETTEGTTAYSNALLFAGKEVTIVYYLGFWLPPAFIGKAFFATMGNNGLAFAELILFIWTFTGVFTVLYLFSRAFSKFSFKLLLVFIFFGGMDILMSVFFYSFGLEGLLFTEGRLIPHLDSWTMQQYTSNTSALFWVFNQAVPLWLFCCIILNEKDLKYTFFPYACLAINSTLPMVGALPIIFYFIITRLKERLTDEGKAFSAKEFFGEVKRYLNLVNISAIPVLAISYLYVSSTPVISTFSFMSGSPDLIKLLIIFASLLFEVALLIILLFGAKLNGKNGLLTVISLLLLIIPFFNLGARYDFTMRASMPALFFLCYLCCYALSNTTKAHVKRLLACVLIIGSFTAIAEILQPTVYVFTGQNPKADKIESLSDITNVNFDPKNCLAPIDVDGFFMKYIFKY